MRVSWYLIYSVIQTCIVFNTLTQYLCKVLYYDSMTCFVSLGSGDLPRVFFSMGLFSPSLEQDFRFRNNCKRCGKFKFALIDIERQGNNLFQTPNIHSSISLARIWDALYLLHFQGMSAHESNSGDIMIDKDSHNTEKHALVVLLLKLRTYTQSTVLKNSCVMYAALPSYNYVSYF